jgi:hypothetical protein
MLPRCSKLKHDLKLTRNLFILGKVAERLEKFTLKVNKWGARGPNPGPCIYYALTRNFKRSLGQNKREQVNLNAIKIFTDICIPF